ncbi:MAG: hypothetical protein ACQCN6_02165 [Candidatus Bathyarchaeia archaeon]|jgi:hypothetical protein
MLTTTAKRYMLPFSTQQLREPEAEAAAVFAFAETQRSKGGGLFTRQPQETLVFIAKLGYPLWLIPRNNTALIFDGLGGSNHNVPYAEGPPAAAFLERLEANERPREKYVAFLSDHGSYFQQPPKMKTFPLNGLLGDADFKSEFKFYRKEAVELLSSEAMLLPQLEEPAITARLVELDKLQANLQADQEKLVECLRFVKKTTGQYLTEIDFEAAAATEEINAKIKAQEEIVKPQIAKLNKEYHKKIKDITASFDDEIESLRKLRAKTEKYIRTTEAKIREYEREAKVQGKKGYAIYEKRWKEKMKIAQKELSGLKKELKKIDDSIKKVSKQKGEGVAQLNFEWDAEVKLLRQPLLELEFARDQKVAAFKAESNRLLLIERPLVNSVNQSIELEESITEGFSQLGIIDPQLKSPLLVYVPFYAVCYEEGLSRRCLYIAPSTVNSADLSTKLKGALGLSRTGNLLSARFRTIADLIDKIESLANQNSALLSQIWTLGEKNNLLKNNSFRADAESGLVYLKHLDWLSERETADLIDRLRLSG